MTIIVVYMNVSNCDDSRISFVIIELVFYYGNIVKYIVKYSETKFKVVYIYIVCLRNVETFIFDIYYYIYYIYLLLDMLLVTYKIFNFLLVFYVPIYLY